MLSRLPHAASKLHVLSCITGEVLCNKIIWSDALRRCTTARKGYRDSLNKDAPFIASRAGDGSGQE